MTIRLLFCPGAWEAFHISAQPRSLFGDLPSSPLPIGQRIHHCRSGLSVGSPVSGSCCGYNEKDHHCMLSSGLRVDPGDCEGGGRCTFGVSYRQKLHSEKQYLLGSAGRLLGPPLWTECRAWGSPIPLENHPLYHPTDWGNLSPLPESPAPGLSPPTTRHLDCQDGLTQALISPIRVTKPTMEPTPGSTPTVNTRLRHRRDSIGSANDACNHTVIRFPLCVQRGPQIHRQWGVRVGDDSIGKRQREGNRGERWEEGGTEEERERRERERERRERRGRRRKRQRDRQTERERERERREREEEEEERDRKTDRQREKEERRSEFFFSHSAAASKFPFQRSPLQPQCCWSKLQGSWRIVLDYWRRIIVHHSTWKFSDLKWARRKRIRQMERLPTLEQVPVWKLKNTDSNQNVLVCNANQGVVLFLWVWQWLRPTPTKVLPYGPIGVVVPGKIPKIIWKVQYPSNIPTFY